MTPSQPLTATQRHRWWILSAMLIGTLVGTFGNSMSNVALPAIMRQYGVDIKIGVWVVSIYVLLFCTFMPIFGRLGDLIGYKRLYLMAMTGLTISMGLSALAPSIGWLIFFRALAGIFNAPILPSIMGIITEVFPAEERGGAMGMWATANGTAHGLGPVISGLLVQSFGWPAVFWFIAALTALGLPLILAFVPADDKRASGHFDLIGAGTLTLAMLLLMFNLNQSLSASYGAGLSLALWAVCAALLAAFVVSQTRLRDPFVDLKLFRQAGYAEVTLVAGSQIFLLFGLQLLLPLFLIGQQHRASGNAGLLIAPLAVSIALISPLAGRLSDRVGSRLTCILGMGLVALAGLSLVFWTAETPVWVIILTLACLGGGMGLTQSPTANAVTLVVGKERLGVALGIFNMLRFIMGTLGATLFGSILARGGGNAAGLPAFHTAFYIFVAVAFGAALLSWRLPAPVHRQMETAHA